MYNLPLAVAIIVSAVFNVSQKIFQVNIRPKVVNSVNKPFNKF